MWTYHQRTGHLFLHGHMIATGYSGAPGSVNDPDAETLHAKGPIPRGHYTIGLLEAHHGTKGPFVMQLTPRGHSAHGRDHFLIHGDNTEVNHTASHGCIILPRDIRLKLGKSGVHDLHVYR